MENFSFTILFNKFLFTCKVCCKIKLYVFLLFLKNKAEHTLVKIIALLIIYEMKFFYFDLLHNMNFQIIAPLDGGALTVN